MNTINDVSSEVVLSSRSKRAAALVADAATIWAVSLVLSIPLIPVWSGLFDSTITDMVANPGLFLFQSFGVVLPVIALVSISYWTLLKQSLGQVLFAVQKRGLLKNVLLTAVLPLLAVAFVIALI